MAAWGSRETGAACRCGRSRARPVFALDYRLAPAHPYPAAQDDVLAAHDSLLAGGAAEVVLFGESAGGTLVLSALLALKAADKPLPRAVAVSPVTDLTLSSPSLSTNDGLDLISRAVLEQALDDDQVRVVAGAEPPLAVAQAAGAGCDRGG